MVTCRKRPVAAEGYDLPNATAVNHVMISLDDWAATTEQADAMSSTGRRVVGAILLVLALALFIAFMGTSAEAERGAGEGPGVWLTASLAASLFLGLWFLIKKAPDPHKMTPKRLLLRAIGSRTTAMLFFVLPMVGGLTALVVGLVFFDLDSEMEPVGWFGAIFSGLIFSVLMLLDFFCLNAVWQGSGPPAYRMVTRLLRQPTTIAKVSDFQMSTHQDGSPMNQGDVHVHFVEGDEYHLYCAAPLGQRIVEVLRAHVADEPAPG